MGRHTHARTKTLVSVAILAGLASLATGCAAAEEAPAEATEAPAEA